MNKHMSNDLRQYGIYLLTYLYLDIHTYNSLLLLKYIEVVEESVTADPVDYDCSDDEIPLNVSEHKL